MKLKILSISYFILLPILQLACFSSSTYTRYYLQSPFDEMQSIPQLKTEIMLEDIHNIPYYKAILQKENKNPLSITAYDEENEMQYQLLFQYDKDQRLQRWDKVDDQDNLIEYVEFFYDRNLLQKAEQRNSNGLLINRYYYEASGLQNKMESFDAQGNRIIIRYFNSQGLLLITRFCDENGFIYRSHTFKYDDSGQLIQSRQYNLKENQCIFHSFSQTNQRDQVIIYDLFGNPLEQSFYFPEGALEIEKTFYQQSVIQTSEHYNQEGALQKLRLYTPSGIIAGEYDYQNGRMVFSTDFAGYHHPWRSNIYFYEENLEAPAAIDHQFSNGQIHYEEKVLNEDEIRYQFKDSFQNVLSSLIVHQQDRREHFQQSIEYYNLNKKRIIKEDPSSQQSQYFTLNGDVFSTITHNQDRIESIDYPSRLEANETDGRPQFTRDTNSTNPSDHFSRIEFEYNELYNRVLLRYYNGENQEIASENIEYLVPPEQLYD